VHIIDKSDVGERLARLNQAGINVETVEQSGPSSKSCSGSRRTSSPATLISASVLC
jgi:hypothetical protein